MARPLRFQYPGAIYHVMNRGANRLPIFIDKDTDRKIFLSVLDNTVSKKKIQVHAFALMPNHYHLLIETPLGNLSAAMKYLDAVFTQRLNKRHRRDGPLFRGRFKSILVEEEQYFLELVRYIHLNGVRAGLVRRPEEDPTSSHPCYVGKASNIRWLTRDKVMSYFSDGRGFSVSEFQRFIEEPLAPEIEKALNQKRWPAILGGKNFIQSIRRKFSIDKSIKNEHALPQRREVRRAHRISPTLIKKLVLQTYKQTTPQSLRGEGKWALMYFLKTEGQQTNQDVATMLGRRSESMVRMFLARRAFHGAERFERIRKMVAKMCDVRL